MESHKREATSTSGGTPAPPITTSPPSEVIVDTGTSEVSSLTSISPNDNPPTDQHEIVPDALVPKAGRPVGTTNEKKREDAEKHKRCVTSIAYAYSTKVTVSKASKTRCPNGFLVDLIQKKKCEFGVQSEIYQSTIRTRVKRGNLAPAHTGALSPIQEAEKALVIICIQMGKIWQPLSCAEGVALYNGGDGRSGIGSCRCP